MREAPSEARPSAPRQIPALATFTINILMAMGSDSTTMGKWLRSASVQPLNIVTKVQRDTDTQFQFIWILSDGNDERCQQSLTWWKSQSSEGRANCKIVVISIAGRMHKEQMAVILDRRPEDLYHGITYASSPTRLVNRLIHRLLTLSCSPTSPLTTQIVLVNANAQIGMQFRRHPSLSDAKDR